MAQVRIQKTIRKQRPATPPLDLRTPSGRPMKY